MTLYIICLRSKLHWMVCFKECHSILQQRVKYVAPWVVGTYLMDCSIRLYCKSFDVAEAIKWLVRTVRQRFQCFLNGSTLSSILFLSNKFFGRRKKIWRLRDSNSYRRLEKASIGCPVCSWTKNFDNTFDYWSDKVAHLLLLKRNKQIRPIVAKNVALNVVHIFCVRHKHSSLPNGPIRAFISVY